MGALTLDPAHGWHFPVSVPVVRNGQLRYVLTAMVKPEAIRALLMRQGLPQDWVISIVDANGRRVARSRAHEENLGGSLSESVTQVVRQGGVEGFGLAYTLENEPIFTPYSALPSSGWTAVLGIPTALVDAAELRSLLVFGGGILLSIGLGTLGALWAARGIVRPMADLRSAAEAMGRRERWAPPETTIQEICEVGAALERAVDELDRGDALRAQLLENERRAREAAESADRAKDEFLAVLSHELRTPLNAVYGWSRLLQGGVVRDPAEINRALEAIVRNADVQVQLIDDLLDLSRITTGKMRLDMAPVEPGPVLRAALDSVRPAAEAKGVRLLADLDHDVGRVIGDAGRLQQIVWNLLMNAVKFTPAEGSVRLNVQRSGTHLQMNISDSGQGIAPEVLPHIFERFRQADSSSTRQHGGLGLGLALVRHLVELHGGTVTARSAGLGRGATFTVTLPVAARPRQAASDPVPAAAATRVPPDRLVRLDGLRVLVVDDDRDALALAESILQEAGADVRTCASVASALAMLDTWKPDVVVSDIEMPAQDGYGLLRELRARSSASTRSIPTIALSAYGRPQDRLRALEAGFSMHVPKPVDPGELTAIIASVASRPVWIAPHEPTEPGVPRPVPSLRPR